MLRLRAAVVTALSGYEPRRASFTTSELIRNPQPAGLFEVDVEPHAIVHDAEADHCRRARRTRARSPTVRTGVPSTARRAVVIPPGSVVPRKRDLRLGALAGFRDPEHLERPMVGALSREHPVATSRKGSACQTATTKGASPVGGSSPGHWTYCVKW
jgi:hypothetical protein